MGNVESSIETTAGGLFVGGGFYSVYNLYYSGNILNDADNILIEAENEGIEGEEILEEYPAITAEPAETGEFLGDDLGSSTAIEIEVDSLEVIFVGSEGLE